jgi:hypothetical protein
LETLKGEQGEWEEKTRAIRWAVRNQASSYLRAQKRYGNSRIKEQGGDDWGWLEMHHTTIIGNR